MSGAPLFFTSPAEFRAWLEEHHATAAEVRVGFWKKATGRPTLTWSESVDQALCFGWIDGIRHSVDADSYMIRFTPRKPQGNWSLVNVKKVEELTAQGLMRPAGVAAFERRTPERTGVYSFERETDAFSPEHLARFQADAAAWAWFSGQAPSYRRSAVHWVTSAKRPETRERRLDTLIADSAAELRVGLFRRP